jgi:hypothetical protein
MPRRIRIIAVPHGDEPFEQRQSLLGVEIPIDKNAHSDNATFTVLVSDLVVGLESDGKFTAGDWYRNYYGLPPRASTKTVVVTKTPVPAAEGDTVVAEAPSDAEVATEPKTRTFPRHEVCLYY